jgi:radical SAM protein with 4Fe4S-binding SPASM domain
MPEGDDPMAWFRKIRHVLLMGVSYKLKLKRPLSPPYQFAIEATNHCNFRCSFCPQSDPEHKNVRETGLLTVENFRLYLARIQETRPGNSNLSICLDGEPLMNKSFPEFIRIANQQGFFPRFSSNGRLLTPAMADELARSGGFLASIDFASEKEIFESLRGRAGDFDIVLENLRYLAGLAAKDPKIKLEIVDIAGFNGADREASLKKMRSLFPPDLPDNVSFWSRNFHNFGGHLKTERPAGQYVLCPYPWSTFSVTWQGDVVACCRDTVGRTILGNAFEQSVAEIWQGEKFRTMRQLLIEKKPEQIAACKNCDMPWTGGEDSERWKLSYILSVLLRR